MSELSGAAELQLLQADVAVAKKQLDNVKAAETTQPACERLASAIQKAESKDGFLVKEGGSPAEENRYHTSAGTTSEDGCCTIL